MTNPVKFTERDDQYNYCALEDTDQENTCRLIIFDRDEETGYRSVRDILEMPYSVLHIWLPSQCEKYEMNPKTDIRLPFECDLGKATTLKGMGKKIAEAAPLGFACAKARRESEGGFVQHVNAVAGGVSYRVSDWCDDSTVASFENGEQIS